MRFPRGAGQRVPVLRCRKIQYSMNTQACIEFHPEFGFTAAMPRKSEPKTTRDILAERIAELKAAGVTHREIAERISPQLSFRTIERWVQRACLPQEWTCELALEKLSNWWSKVSSFTFRLTHQFWTVHEILGVHDSGIRR